MVTKPSQSHNYPERLPYYARTRLAPLSVSTLSSGSMSTEASLSIRFLIIGETAAGLASAVCLKRAGHEVVLLEREGSLDKVVS